MKVQLKTKKREGFEVPILFMVFNRPDVTARAFDVIKEVKPKRLFVSADGPRKGVSADKIKCLEAREITEDIDWNCKVERLYRDKNFGLEKAVTGALDWFFSHVRKGVVLEDDCVPDKSFFRFMEELLEKYKDDRKVMSISGDNFQDGIKRGLYSYYFSKYTHCWGWGTWRRAWALYDFEMRLWPEVKKCAFLNNIIHNKAACVYWKNTFDLVYTSKINSWAYRWMFSCLVNSGVTVLPNVNLVKNIGFEGNATNTKFSRRLKKQNVSPIRFPLKHPLNIIVDERADAYTEKRHFINPRTVGGLMLRKLGI